MCIIEWSHMNLPFIFFLKLTCLPNVKILFNSSDSLVDNLPGKLPEIFDAVTCSGKRLSVNLLS